MVNICVCVCAFGSAAPRGHWALPQPLGTAIASPTSQLIGACKISPLAKGEISLLKFLQSGRARVRKPVLVQPSLAALPWATCCPAPCPLQRQSTWKFLVHRRYPEEAGKPLGCLAAPAPRGQLSRGTASASCPRSRPARCTAAWPPPRPRPCSSTPSRCGRSLQGKQSDKSQRQQGKEALLPPSFLPNEEKALL